MRGAADRLSPGPAVQRLRPLAPKANNTCLQLTNEDRVVGKIQEASLLAHFCLDPSTLFEFPLHLRVKPGVLKCQRPEAREALEHLNLALAKLLAWIHVHHAD